MTSPAIYATVPETADLTAALASNVPITDPQPNLLKRIMDALRPLRQLGARFITPEQYGAVGDGVTNDAVALQAALNALTPGATLYLGPGKTYVHTTVLTTPANVDYYTIAGAGRLLATNQTSSALIVKGNFVSLLGFTKEKTATTVRQDPYAAQNIVTDGCDNLYINDVTSIGGSGTGFFITRCTNFRLVRLRVENTLADGIHMTGGSSNGIVIDPRVRQAGDDGVSVVSYVGGSDGGMCQNIDVINPVVLGSKAGRGVTCVGGTNIRFYNITIEDTFAAGVYIANETYGNNPIHPVTNILVSGGTIRKANRNTDPNGVAGPVDHGSVLISSQRDGVTNTGITIEGLECYDTRSNVPWEVGIIASDGTNTNIIIRNMTFINGPATYYAGANATNGGVNSNITRYGWTRITTASAVAS